MVSVDSDYYGLLDCLKMAESWRPVNTCITVFLSCNLKSTTCVVLMRVFFPPLFILRVWWGWCPSLKAVFQLGSSPDN